MPIRTASVRLVEKFLHGRRERAGIARRHNKSVHALGNRVAAAMRIGGNDGTAGRERLQYAARDAFAIVGRQDENSGLRKVWSHIMRLAKVLDNPLGRPSVHISVERLQADLGPTDRGCGTWRLGVAFAGSVPPR